MGRTCGEPDEIELTAMGLKLNGSRCRHTGGVLHVPGADHHRGLRSRVLHQHDLRGVHGSRRTPPPAERNAQPELLAPRRRGVLVRRPRLRLLAAARDTAPARTGCGTSPFDRAARCPYLSYRAAGSGNEAVTGSHGRHGACLPSAVSTMVSTAVCLPPAGSDGNDGTDAAAGARRDDRASSAYSTATTATAASADSASAGSDVARAAAYTIRGCTGYANIGVTGITSHSRPRPKRECGGRG